MRLLRCTALLLLSVVLLAREPVRARNGMVVAQEPISADVGLSVLQAGGNAVDAAIAMGFALAVTYPQAGNIGGGGFMLIRFADGRSTFIDFRERAPAAAARDMYLDAAGNVTRDSLVGWRAAGVPGTVHGLEYAHGKYGSRPWASLVQPAVDLARNGVVISFAQAEALQLGAGRLNEFPESKRIFLRDGAYYEPGERLVQADLAATLQRIAGEGSKGFYGGETARRLAAEMKANGGLVTADDLKNYTAVEREPLKGSYKGYGVLTAPPPSAGGVGLLQMLGVLEGSGYEESGFESAASIHYVAEVMRRHHADRRQFLADPDFADVPVEGLLAKDYVDRIRSAINTQRTTPSSNVLPGVPVGYESPQTTHVSVIDAEGTAVSMTYTINDLFGSGVTVPGLGFLLNDEMDDFTSKPGEPNLFGLIQGEVNAIEPGKRPLSSMTPTILTYGEDPTEPGEVFMVLGAPGGPRIVTGVLQVILNVIDFHMNIQEAIDAPRFHHQWLPDELRLEDGFSPDTVRLLEAKGHAIGRIGAVAHVEAIVKGTEWLQGGADGRSDGKAAGY